MYNTQVEHEMFTIHTVYTVYIQYTTTHPQ